MWLASGSRLAPSRSTCRPLCRLCHWMPGAPRQRNTKGTPETPATRWTVDASLLRWLCGTRMTITGSSPARTESSIELFCSMVAKLAKTPKSRHARAREDCVQFARAIIQRWSQRSHDPYVADKRDPVPLLTEFATALPTLNDRDTVAEFLSTACRIATGCCRWTNSCLQRAAHLAGHAFTDELKGTVPDAVGPKIRRGVDAA